MLLWGEQGTCEFSYCFPVFFFFPGVCAVNGLLYVVGGDDGSCNLSTVEYYNPTTDKWTVVSSCMSTGRSYAGNVYRYFFNRPFTV